MSSKLTDDTIVSDISSKDILKFLDRIRFSSFSPDSGRLWFSLGGVVERASFPESIISFGDHDDCCIENENDKEYKHACDVEKIIPYYAWKIEIPGDKAEFVPLSRKRELWVSHELIKGYRPRNIIYEIKEYGRFSGSYYIDVLTREGYLPIRGSLDLKTRDTGREIFPFPPHQVIFDIERGIVLRSGIPKANRDDETRWKDEINNLLSLRAD